MKPIDMLGDMQQEVAALCAAHPLGGETATERALALLIPTPGYKRTFTEIRAEIEALGLPVELEITLLASGEEQGYFGGPFRPQLNA